jgi:hypothetical protein
MKTSSHSHKRACGLKVAALAGTIALLGGCVTDNDGAAYDSDGTAGVMNQEANGMGDVWSSQLAKAADSDSERQLEVVITPLQYDSACQCFVRTASFSHSNPHGKTFTRSRSDSIWLDSSGQRLSLFHPAHASTITHHRHVVKLSGAMDIDMQINMTMTRTIEDGDTVRTWNGTITGTYDGVPFKDGEINGVVYSFLAGFWVPTGGSMHVRRGDFTIDLTFKGSGKAQAVVKGHGRTRKIECDGGSES